MVCIPCIVIPFFLWIFHRFLRPFILKFWDPWKKPISCSGDNIKDKDTKSQPDKAESTAAAGPASSSEAAVVSNKKED